MKEKRKEKKKKEKRREAKRPDKPRRLVLHVLSRSRVQLRKNEKRKKKKEKKKKEKKKKKATNYGKSLVASSLTCPLKIPCQRNGHQSLHSGFNIDCLGEKVLRLRLVVVVESTPQLEQAAWR